MAYTEAQCQHFALLQNKDRRHGEMGSDLLTLSSLYVKLSQVYSALNTKNTSKLGVTYLCLLSQLLHIQMFCVCKQNEETLKKVDVL
jgi:hypothetical protein